MNKTKITELVKWQVTRSVLKHFGAYSVVFTPPVENQSSFHKWIGSSLALVKSSNIVHTTRKLSCISKIMQNLIVFRIPVTKHPIKEYTNMIIRVMVAFHSMIYFNPWESKTYSFVNKKFFMEKLPRGCHANSTHDAT